MTTPPHNPTWTQAQIDYFYERIAILCEDGDVKPEHEAIARSEAEGLCPC